MDCLDLDFDLDSEFPEVSAIQFEQDQGLSCDVLCQTQEALGGAFCGLTTNARRSCVSSQTTHTD